MRMVRLMKVDADSLRHLIDQLPAEYNLDQWYPVKGSNGSDWEIKMICPTRLMARQRTAFVTLTGETVYAAHRYFSINLQRFTCREVYSGR